MEYPIGYAIGYIYLFMCNFVFLFLEYGHSGGMDAGGADFDSGELSYTETRNFYQRMSHCHTK